MDLSQVPLQDVERIEVVRGPQSALYGADAIGGVVQIITRSGGQPSARRTSKAEAATMRAIAAPRPARSTACAGKPVAITTRTTASPVSPSNGQTVTNDDARSAQGRLTLGWRHRRAAAMCRGRPIRRHRAGSPGPYGSDPAHRFRRRHGSSRHHRRESAAGGGMQPWFGPSSRSASAWSSISRTTTSLQERVVTSEGKTRRSQCASQTDVASRRVGFSGGVEWLGERGSSTFIAAGSGPVPVERACWDCSARHAGTPPIARASRRACAASTSPRRAARRSDIALRGRRPIFSVNPSRGNLVAGARPGVADDRGRASTARSARAFVRPMRSRWRSPTIRAEAGAQPERGARRHADVAGRRGPARRHGVLQPV